MQIMYDIHRWLYFRLRRHFFSLAHFFFVSLSLSNPVALIDVRLFECFLSIDFSLVRFSLV